MCCVYACAMCVCVCDVCVRDMCVCVSLFLFVCLCVCIDLLYRYISATRLPCVVIEGGSAIGNGVGNGEGREEGSLVGARDLVDGSLEKYTKALPAPLLAAGAPTTMTLSATETLVPKPLLATGPRLTLLLSLHVVDMRDEQS